MCEVRQSLQCLRRLLAVQLRLNLAHLLVGLGEKLALQVIQFQIHHHLGPLRHCMRDAAPAGTV